MGGSAPFCCNSSRWAFTLRKFSSPRELGEGQRSPDVLVFRGVALSCLGFAREVAAHVGLSREAIEDLMGMC